MKLTFFLHISFKSDNAHSVNKQNKTKNKIVYPCRNKQNKTKK